jgi:hypothetical protein
MAMSKASRRIERESTGSSSQTCRFSRFKEVVEKLQWYALRWKIELFHKILKSGCALNEPATRE